MSRHVFVASRLVFLFFLLPVVADHAVTTAEGVDPSSSSEEATPSPLTIDRIYHSDEFNGKSFGGKWLEGESAYTTLEPSKRLDGGTDIVRHDAATGKSTVIVDASSLVPAGEEKPLKIESYAWSKNKNLVLIFTNSKRVWRNNTRGDYWILDRTSGQLHKLGREAPPSTLMFAKISPMAKQVAYVRQGNIFIEDLLDHTAHQITQSESDEVINGTTDWVYEEELGLRDAFRWSPDGQWIAYWQIDTRGVQKFPLINHTDTLYPKVRWFAYPKVGQRNPRCRIGLIRCDTGESHWVDLPGSDRDHYVPRIDFLPLSGDEDKTPRLLIQQLNRLQNTNRLFLADLRSNTVSMILTETDDAWVDVHDELHWVDDGRHFTWISDRDGWRHVYSASLDGGEPRCITPGEFDVIELLHVDEPGKKIYFVASPESASDRYLYQVGLDGRNLRRVTPPVFAGVHRYQISTDAAWAIHTRSSASRPPITDLVSLTNHEVIRVLESNEDLIRKLEQLDQPETEFFRVDIGDGVQLDGWCIQSSKLDADKQHPLVVYVYGEPAGSTVVNRWGGKSQLWHWLLAQHGYVVMSFDNRGTKAPRGREWRKSIYKQIGILPPRDQAAAVQAILDERSDLDRSRVGIWGWSGGGSSSLHAIFKYPELYSTAIAIAPVPNQRYYDTIYQERYMSLPELNVDGFREGSAINFAKNLEGNLLLVHGTGDDNCHYQTTELLIDELVAHNKQFSLMAYPNRTHSIKERKNTTRHLRNLMTQFLIRHLPPNEP